MIAFFIAAGLSVVSNVPQCVARTTTRLEAARSKAGRRNNAEGDDYVFYMTRGNVGVAKRYMTRHGYIVLTSNDPRELIFRADIDLETGRRQFEKGLKLACTASKLSRVPFRSVERHNGTFIIYSVPAN